MTTDIVETLAYEKGGDIGHVYIVRYEDMQNVFKVGRSTNLFSRLSYYPPTTKLVFCIECSHSLKTFEKVVIMKFNSMDTMTLINNNREYFNGCVQDAILIVMQCYTDFYKTQCAPPIQHDDINLPLDDCTIEECINNYALSSFTNMLKSTQNVHVSRIRHLTKNLPSKDITAVQFLNDSDTICAIINSKKTFTTQQAYYSTINIFIKNMKIPVSNEALASYNQRVIATSSINV